MIDLYLNPNDGRWVLHATNCLCKRTRKDRNLNLEGRFNSSQDAQKVWEQRNDAGVTEHFCLQGDN